MTYVATFDDAAEVAEEGEGLYATRYQKDCERDFPGFFAAIDVNTGELHVAEFSEIAIQKAQQSNPNCVVHIVQIGEPSAVSMGYLFAA